MPFDSHQIWKTGKFYRAEQMVKDLNLNYSSLSSINGSSTEYYSFKIKNYKGKLP